MQPLGRFSIVRTAPPVLTDTCIGVGVAVLSLAASWNGAAALLPAAEVPTAH
jgi:hypothetical protein